MKPFETIQIHSMEIACDGGALGHPRVFLKVDRDSHQIQCPYCSRLYVLDEKPEQAAG